MKVADGLSKKFGQQFIVDNIGGAGGAGGSARAVGIPSRGGGPLMTDLLGGPVPMVFINQDAALPHVKAGKLRSLAVTSKQRNPLYPDVPTIAESGLEGYEAISWSGLSAIKGTPQPIIDKLEAAVKKIMASPEICGRRSSRPQPSNRSENHEPSCPAYPGQPDGCRPRRW